MIHQFLPRRSRALGAAAILIALVALAACGRSGPEAPSTAELTAGSAQTSPVATSSPDTATSPGTATSSTEQFDGILVGFTPDGYPYRGDPNAPVTMYEWSDFQCPFCSRYFVQTEPAVDDAYVRTGKVRVVFRDLPIEGLHPNAPAAHEAARCVAQQGAPLYWAMHDELFRSQTEWQALQDPRPVFERLAGEVGANVDAMKTCVEDAVERPGIQASLQEATSLGLDGTPSFRIVENASGKAYALIGAQPFNRFASTLDAVLAGEVPAEAEQPAQPGSAPLWATAAGLALDPARPGYTVAGDPTRGNPDAQVVVVEFTDFQCPYCKKHHEETQPAIDEKFVDSGEIRWVFKHFPLSIHPQAPAAGVAAECAADQGKFWEMGTSLFENVSEWSIGDPSPVFTQMAVDLGMDADAFTACLSDPAKKAIVDADEEDGQPYVQGTPTFVILSKAGGRIIPGALPLATFSDELQKVLDAAGS